MAGIENEKWKRRTNAFEQLKTAIRFTEQEVDEFESLDSSFKFESDPSSSSSSSSDHNVRSIKLKVSFKQDSPLFPKKKKGEAVASKPR